MVQPFVDSQVNISDFAEAFNLAPGSCVSLIGAGGKTTIMYALAQAALGRGLQTVITTTTKIWPPPNAVIHLADDAQSAIRAANGHSDAHDTVVLGQSLGPDGKLEGISPEMVCALIESGGCDVVLCEADGAAGRSLKVHGPGEPVIPACSTSVIVVAGMDAANNPAGPATVHRFERFVQRFPEHANGPLTPSTVAAALIVAAGHVPAGAQPIFLLNKLDNDALIEAAKAVSEKLLQDIPDSRILGASHGRLVALQPSETLGLRPGYAARGAR